MGSAGLSITMCLHTLCLTYEGCPHLSPVPQAGPEYISPSYCSPVRYALDYYHTQPQRYPEAWPVPLPHPCEPIWGTETCKGNVLTILKQGQCDKCVRFAYIFDMAQCLIYHLNFCHKDSLAENKSAALFNIWGDLNSEELRYKRMEWLATVNKCVENSPSLKIKSAIASTIQQVLIDGQDVVMIPDTWRFWSTFGDVMRGKLTWEEEERLLRFIRTTHPGSGPITARYQQPVLTYAPKAADMRQTGQHLNGFQTNSAVTPASQATSDVHSSTQHANTSSPNTSHQGSPVFFFHPNRGHASGGPGRRNSNRNDHAGMSRVCLPDGGCAKLTNIVTLQLPTTPTRTTQATSSRLPLICAGNRG